MPEGSSDNLMDYTDNETATRLHKYQWDYIHDPEGGLYLFQDEEEGAEVTYGLIEKINENSAQATPVDISFKFPPSLGQVFTKYNLFFSSKPPSLFHGVV